MSPTEPSTKGTTSSNRLVADELVTAMEHVGVRAAFGITGGAFGTVFDRMNQSPLIQVYHSQQETMAAYAAMGRAIASDCRELPVCFSTGGPGITNLLTGVTAAYCESVPMMVLTGNSSSRLRNKGALHDSYPGGVDVLRMFEPVTLKNARASRAADVVPMFLEFAALSLERRKPVHLNVPLDVSNLPSPPVVAEPTPPAGWTELSAAERESIERFLQSERPLVFVGNGVKLSGDGDQLRQVLERHRLPAIVTTHARGAIPEDSECFRGTFGFASDGAGQLFLTSYQPDAILFLGTGLGEMSTCGWSDLLGRADYRVHVDVDAAKFNRGYQVHQTIHNEVARVLEYLSSLAVERDRVPASVRSSMVAPRLEARSAEELVHPERVLKDVCDLLPKHGALFADPGNSMAWAFRSARLHGPQQLFVPLGLASMGSGLGAALGASTFWHDRDVVCISGDCAMLMCGNELKTAVEYQIPISIVVINDRGHGMVHHGSRLVGLESTFVRFRERVDFKSFAESLGFRAFRARSTGEWQSLVQQRELFGKGPTLVDVWIDESVQPPIADRARVVNEAGATGLKNSA